MSNTYVSDVAFTPAVKEQQARLGSRSQYERMEQGDGWPDTITPDLGSFIATVQSFYLGTASRDGQPYIQHRGGPPGFLHVLDDRTVGFADFAGNRQYITAGNLSENPRAFLFLMDYTRQIRIKIWGMARIVEDDDTLLANLRPTENQYRAERSILFAVSAWDRNCRQHIPRYWTTTSVEAAVQPLQKRILQLEKQIEDLRLSRD